MIITLISGCAINGRETESIGDVIQQTPVVIDTACKWVKPVFISKQDVLTDGTARQILAHNETYLINCPSKE